jgi:hypothetical protein
MRVTSLFGISAALWLEGTFRDGAPRLPAAGLGW